MPNQIDYLRALATTSLVDVVLGKFKNKTIFCKFPTCTQTGKRPFEVPEEKPDRRKHRRIYA